MKTTTNTYIMSTVNNPSAAVMEYLAKLQSVDATIDSTIGPTTPVQDAPIITPQADPQDTALRIASLEDLDNYLDIGTDVHWKGQKFEFDGVVERIETDDVVDDAGDGIVWVNYDTKVLFIRRNDTGKLVSLNLRDLQTGCLTLVD